MEEDKNSNGDSKHKLVSVAQVSLIKQDDIELFAFSFGVSGLLAKSLHSVSVLKIVYHTRYQHRQVKASGLLFIPLGVPNPPLLSAQHGTTFKKSEAPSVSMGFSGMEFLAALGYITILPDYLGYGESASLFHPYYEANLSAYTVIDMVLAVREYLEQEKIRYDNKLFLAGYSEGGYVTLAAQKEIEENPSLNYLSLKAVAAGAGGYDLFGMLQSLSTQNYFSFPAYLAFIIEAYNKVYHWKKPLNYFFREEYAEKFKTLLDGSYEGRYVNNQLPNQMDKLFNEKFYANLKGNGELQLKRALIKNTLLNWKSVTPLRLYHGTSDEIIPFKNSEQTYTTLKENGANDLSFIALKGNTHGNSLLPMIASLIPWFENYKKI